MFGFDEVHVDAAGALRIGAHGDDTPAAGVRGVTRGEAADMALAINGDTPESW